MRTVDSAEGAPEYKTVAYSQVVPWLVEGIKQQDATIAALERNASAAAGRAAALEGRLAEQTRELAALRQQAVATEAATARRLADVEAKLAVLMARL